MQMLYISLEGGGGGGGGGGGEAENYIHVHLSSHYWDYSSLMNQIMFLESCMCMWKYGLVQGTRHKL